MGYAYTLRILFLILLNANNLFISINERFFRSKLFT